MLHPTDNIAIARSDVPAGMTIQFESEKIEITTLQEIGLGHKVACKDIPEGLPVYKFGQVIGFTIRAVKKGEWVHEHNLTIGELDQNYSIGTEIPPEPEPIKGKTFAGYRRKNGKAGTRNYLAVVSTVNCSATASRMITDQLQKLVENQFPNIDGVIPIVHQGGCAFGHDGEDHKQLTRVLGGFADHPNIAASLILGLGCETGHTSYLVEQQNLIQIDLPGQKEASTSFVMNIQEEGGIAKTVDRAIGKFKEILPAVDQLQRIEIPASELIMGTECGGSDGNSGVTANPAVGIASDLLVACGGTSILSETPEIYGAEHLLLKRAISEEVANKLIERIKWWEWYTSIFGAEINNNPSFGNKKGGLTTIFEKSLGAIAKGGSTALKEVYRYAEKVTKKGFVFMDTPGYDPASVTGMIAGGAQVVLFTTGRGSCFSCKPVPTIKVATNTKMNDFMLDDMDINAGKILEGASLTDVGEEIFEATLAVASGKKTKSELQGIGNEEFCPWNIGPTL